MTSAEVQIFRVYENKGRLIYLCEDGIDDPSYDTAVAIVTPTEDGDVLSGYSIIETSDGYRSRGMLDTYWKGMPANGSIITHKFTCMPRVKDLI